MTTKRRPIKRNPKLRVTPEAVALWVRLNEILAAGLKDDWDDQTCRNEYLDTAEQLREALGLHPWEANVEDADTDDPPDYMLSTPLAVEGWRTAREWRRLLEEADREPERAHGALRWAARRGGSPTRGL
jgi:hypothetical protein